MKGMKILENAMKWKKMMTSGGADAGEGSSGGGAVETAIVTDTAADNNAAGDSNGEGDVSAGVLGKRKDVPSSSDKVAVEDVDPHSIDIEDESD